MCEYYKKLNEEKEQKWVYSCGNNQMLKCNSTYMSAKKRYCISGRYIRDEHKKMTGDYKDLWTYQFERCLHT